MNDQGLLNPPAVWARIQAETTAQGFTMPSDAPTGAFLRALTASKPGGRLLELGTGTGLATAWIAAGMDRAATLISVDNDAALQAIAQKFLGHDTRIEFRTQDGGEFIQTRATEQRQTPDPRFDFIFADTWPGKYTHLEETLALLAPGGLYVVDDMLPQPNWPADHPPKVAHFIAHMESRADFAVVKLNWASGLMVATRRAD